MRRHRPDGQKGGDVRATEQEEKAKPVPVPGKSQTSGPEQVQLPTGDETPRATVPVASRGEADHTPVHTSFISKSVQEDLKHLAGELAIVCPMVDGRLKDLADEEGS